MTTPQTRGTGACQVCPGHRCHGLPGSV